MLAEPLDDCVMFSWQLVEHWITVEEKVGKLPPRLRESVGRTLPPSRLIGSTLDQCNHGLRGLQFHVTPCTQLGVSIELIYLTCSDLLLQGGVEADLVTFEQR